jgi:hypothetical protein
VAFDITSDVFISSFLELRADGLDILNGYDTLHKRLNTVAFYFHQGVSALQSDYTFEVGNFNSRSINFKLYEDNNTISAMDESWILILKLQGIE